MKMKLKKFNFFLFLINVTMFFITIEFYKNAKVNVIKDSETDNYFWVEMKDVENGLGLKCIRSLIRKEICGIYDTDNLTKEKESI